MSEVSESRLEGAPIEPIVTEIARNTIGRAERRVRGIRPLDPFNVIEISAVLFKREQEADILKHVAVEQLVEWIRAVVNSVPLWGVSRTVRFELVRPFAHCGRKGPCETTQNDATSER